MARQYKFFCKESINDRVHFQDHERDRGQVLP